MKFIVDPVALKRALKTLWICCCAGQTEPDGNNCALCSACDHQAFECRFNIYLTGVKLLKEAFHGKK